MNSFIFGFQRFVWWPKCTPASSRSFIAMPNKSSLSFTELEAFPRSGHPVFLAFLGARVAREQPLGLQRLAELEVVDHERPRDAEAHGAGLARHAAAGDRREDVELIRGFGEHERQANLCAQRFAGKERLERATVDADGPGAGAEEHAGGGGFPASGSVVLSCCQVTRPRAWRVSAPSAGDPARRTLSACDTSPRPSSSWAASRGWRPRRGARDGAHARRARASPAGRPRSQSADDKSSDLPCGP